MILENNDVVIYRRIVMRKNPPNVIEYNTCIVLFMYSK